MEKQTHDPMFVRVPQASRITGLPAATIYDKFHRGEIAGVQLGTTVLISLEGLKALERKALKLGESD